MPPTPWVPRGGSGGLSEAVTAPWGAVSPFIPELSHLCLQAGRKQLLLTPRLGQSQVSPVSPVSPGMSMARRRILEEERARVIQAYRDIQRRKQLERDRAGPG